ncbi:TrkH family potassium uptake protein [Lachnospiraceae bacterium ZAX-1]
MNYSMVRYILCRVLEFQALFLGLPCIVALIYKEKSGWAYFIVLLACLLVGRVGKRVTPKSNVFYAREGFVAVSLSWIVLSLTGALPLYFSGEISNYIDALFETVSGFTTTGATMLVDVEALSQCSLFWRCFINWIGGMGVLVFMLAILPLAGGYSMHLLRAEAPGHNVGKLVPRVRHTARLLYSIYVVMTVVLILLFLLTGVRPFDALTLAFGTAGTGGFAILNDSVASYSVLVQIIIIIFMIVFGINFHVFYLVLAKKPFQAFKNEEFRYYMLLIGISIVLVTWNIWGEFDSVFQTIHQAVFQATAIITTTGYSTVDYVKWPVFSQTILIIMMFIGACSGSTGGGMKISRVVIILKILKNEISHLIQPKRIRQIHFEKNVVPNEVLKSIQVYAIAYIMIFAVSVLLVSLDKMDPYTNITAVAALLNNIGPGFGLVGPMGNYGIFSSPIKCVLMFDMLVGRLELFPLLVMLSPSTWKKR